MGSTKTKLTKWSEKLAEEAPRIRDESPALAAILSEIASEMCAEAASAELNAPPPPPFEPGPLYPASKLDALRAENDHLSFALERAAKSRVMVSVEVTTMDEELDRVYGLLTHLRARAERRKASVVELDRMLDESENRAMRRIESIHASLAGVVGVRAETIDEQIDLVRSAVRARSEVSRG